jgi:hypothetical protein
MTTIVEADWRAETVDRLEAVWAEDEGLVPWLSTVDHKRIGMRYFYTGFAFFIAGGIEALLIRTQLASFWKDRPAPVLLGAVLGTQALATLIAVYGLFMTPIGWWRGRALMIWAYALAWFVVNDRVKLATYGYLDAHPAETPRADTDISTGGMRR